MRSERQPARQPSGLDSASAAPIFAAVSVMHELRRRVRDAAVDAEPVEQIDHILARDVAGRPRRIGAAAQSCDRAVEHGDAAFERRQDIRQRLAVGVVTVEG